MPTCTDNRRNGALFNKLTSTKTPICAVLMELALQMKEMEQKTTVNWTPRTANRDADSLANGDASEFDPALEVEFRKHRLQWRVLPEALEMAREAEAAVAEAKRKGALPLTHGEQRSEKLSSYLFISCGTLFVVGYFLILVWVLWCSSLLISGPLSVRPHSPLLVLLVPVEMLTRAVVLSTIHTSCMLVRTVVLCTIEVSCTNESS